MDQRTISWQSNQFLCRLPKTGGCGARVFMPSHEESRELRCLTAITEGRLYFCEKLADHASRHLSSTNSRHHLDEIIRILRGDNTYNVAKFFYLMEELSLAIPDNLRMLIHRHNDDMNKLLGDTTRTRMMGLSPQRVEEAIFSADQEDKIFIDNDLTADGKVQLDQSDLSKLLSPLMSPESCRQTMLTLAESGLLNRRGRGRLFISSSGVLERYFREHLTLTDRLIINASDGGEEESVITNRASGY
jgi:hypothetical protein